MAQARQRLWYLHCIRYRAYMPTASTASDDGGDGMDAIGRGTILVLERFMLGRGKEED